MKKIEIPFCLPQITVRYKEATAVDTRKYGAASLPAVVFVSRSGKEEEVGEVPKTSRGLTKYIMKKFGLNRGMLPYKTHLAG